MNIVLEIHFTMNQSYLYVMSNDFLVFLPSFNLICVIKTRYLVQDGSMDQPLGADVSVAAGEVFDPQEVVVAVAAAEGDLSSIVLEVLPVVVVHGIPVAAFDLEPAADHTGFA